MLIGAILLGVLVVSASGSVCDFESGQACPLWTLSNSADLDKDPFSTQTPNKANSFRIVVGSGFNNSNHYAYFSSNEHRREVPMVVSDYFQHTASACELTFKHQLHGIPGAELLVTTQHLEHRAMHEFEDNDEDREDWIRPTFRAHYKPAKQGQDRWIDSRVPIGQIQFPARIRIECHSAPQQKDLNQQNVECRLDDIKLENCEEEVWQPDECVSQQSKKYLCRKGDQPRCIDYDEVCDMHSACDLDEDEDNQLHACEQVPPGARCDFELQSETGCPHWKFQSKSANDTSKFLRRISLQETHQFHPHGLPPGEYFSHGSFVFFSTYGSQFETQNPGEVLYSSVITPPFPPTNPKTSAMGSPEYKSCLVRFFYCHTGSSTFHLMLEKGAEFGTKEMLWTPPKTSGTAPCSWQKASTVIPHQSRQYRLKIAFGKLYKQPLSVAIDDFSMTPDCFTEESSWASKYLPPRIDLTSCPNGQVTSNGVCPVDADISQPQTWLLPETGHYLVAIYGASGGRLPEQKANNRGGLLLAELKLRKGQELRVMVGSEGTSPCQAGLVKVTSNKTVTYSDKLFDVICARKTPDSAELDLLRKDLQNLFGSGGGGASLLFIDDKLVAVAGAGGGVLPAIFPTTDEVDPRGGTDSVRPHAAFKHWAAGNGLSFNQSAKPDNTCADCQAMDGRQVMGKVVTYPGGACPPSRLWSVPGGYGGGGASCGPGAGGGAGFIGGGPGHKSHGQGGSSMVLIQATNLLYKAGVNSGDGRASLLRCTLRCPVNSTCTFRLTDPNNLGDSFCLCLDGLETDEHGTCTPSFILVDLANRIARSLGIRNTFVGVALFFLFFFLFMACLLVCLCCRREPGVGFYLKQYRWCWLVGKRSEPEFEFEMTDTIDSRFRMGDRITPNPIYERLTMMELPQISRHFLQLKQSIGHGAFGEVYEGLFILDGAATKVAVKTLPMGSNPETDVDFESEARLLNHFDHPNIVKFYGVSFEKLPKYIILEYLEGGDLRNFLRESRPKTESRSEVSNLKMIDLINMALDVAYGCEYLEQSKFIHRDIAARNCLLTSKGPGRVVKIADFGMARDIYTSEYYRKGGRAFLAVKWMPPEAFLDGIFNSKTDVWAYGVLLWEIFSMGYMPYTMRANQDVMQLVVAGGRLEPPVGCPEEVYNEMLKCWHTVADSRPDFTELVSFFTMLASDSVMASLPIPPLLRRQRQPTPSESSNRSSQPTTEDVGTSQATVSTAMTESTSNSSPQAMPTAGQGVQLNVFPAYESRCAKPLMQVGGWRPDSVAQVKARTPLNRDMSLSSHDDSTLHDTCSVKQVNRLDKDSFARLPENEPFPGTPPTPPPRCKKPTSQDGSA